MNALIVNAPVLLIAIPLVGAFAVPLIGRISVPLRRIFTGLIALLTTACAGLVAAHVFTTAAPITYVLGGMATLPSGMHFPVRIILEVDGMSAFMVILTALVLITAIFYSFPYWRRRSGGNMYEALFLLLGAGIFGMELTGDLFNFFVFLEITSIAACGLIGFRVWQGRSQEAAFKTMTLYTISGLFVLLAIGLLYGEYDGLNIAYLAAHIGGSMIDKIALGLLLTALAMKAGAVPMHMWAPDAYGEAPAPIAAVLVANSQASLYGLFRVLFTLYGLTISVTALGWILITLALLTIFVGVTMALIQSDIKRLIAYGAVSQIGYMLLGVGVGLATSAGQQPFGLVAMQGGIFHMINDAACVGLLFLSAGAVIRAAGTRNLNRMGGLGHDLPWTAVFFMIGSFALAGIPPFNGFASKLMIYESTFRYSPILAVIAILGSILLLAVFVKVFQSAFLGPRLGAPAARPSGWMFAAMGTLAVVVIAFGLFPGFFVHTIVTPAAKALWMGRDAYIGAVMGG